MINQMKRIRSLVKESNPHIHSITNPISINQCANAVLSVGARPVMAEHPEEVAGITRSANALMVNLGNITDVRLQSIRISVQTAKENGIPFVLDVVGVACSELRRKFAYEITEKCTPDIIKGNYSEINALYNSAYTSSGVDSDPTLDREYISKISAELAKKYNSVILASGKTDIITDGKRIIYVHNGTSQLASVTGTGCMLGALCACFLSAERNLYSSVCACAFMGICGELSETNKGSGSFMINLMDRLSTLSDEDIINNLKTEEVKIEEI